MVHAFYGVRTGFIRRGGVSFFAWPGQLVLDDWGMECRLDSAITGRRNSISPPGAQFFAVSLLPVCKIRHGSSFISMWIVFSFFHYETQK
jgi:hypothetical protein